MHALQLPLLRGASLMDVAYRCIRTVRRFKNTRSLIECAYRREIVSAGKLFLRGYCFDNEKVLVNLTCEKKIAGTYRKKTND